MHRTRLGSHKSAGPGGRATAGSASRGKGKAKGRQERVMLPRLRLMVGTEIALGPGRVELLELIAQEGSLRGAAKQMGISYMRAWQLVKLTNRCFRGPLVEIVRGGKSGGGASLTESGQKALALYRGMEADCLRSTRKEWKELRKLLG
ncbi:MAG TPA: LysR family transcriptional regulator [Candidatus Dormibacteraeota bacterium]|nr:LysR family transcriptional regulator [Candidatus Dormibacteraeota bacterium]